MRLAIARGRVALAVAASLHIVALLALRRSAFVTPSAAERSAAVSPIDVELTSEPPSAGTAAVASDPPSFVKSFVTQPVSRRALAASPPASAGEPIPDAVDTGNWSLAATTTHAPVDLSLGSTRYQGSAIPDDHPAPPVEAAVSHETREGLLAALDAHDLELGLNRGSPVLLAVEEVVQRTEAGVLGVALFDVSVNPGGGIEVDLVQAAHEASTWASLADSIATAVGRKEVRRPLRGGLKVRVRVEAVERFADGRATSSLGTSGGASLGRVDPSSMAMKEMPNVGVEHRGKICSEGASIDPNGLHVAGGCSLENLGAPPRRMVAARIVSETRL